MNEEKKESASNEEVGSSNVNPNTLGGELDGKNFVSPKTDETVPKKHYDELEKKIGSQGLELGETRKKVEEYETFIEGVTPALEKLEADPDLYYAIMNGKIDSNLVKAALEGKITLENAKQVTEAHQEVKKDLGKKGYEETKPADIEKMISDKLEAMKETINNDLEKNLKEERELREYEDGVKTFLTNTKDFSEYAEDIKKYMDEKDITDVEMAYHVVKGMALASKAEKSGSANAAKDLATNAGGGSSQATGELTDQELVDKLIGGPTNPNLF